MPENDQGTPNAASEAAAKPAKKSKLIPIIIVVVVALGAGGGGFYYWRASAVNAAEVKTKKNEKKSESKSESKDDSSDEKPVHSEDAKKTGGKSAALETALPDDKDVKKIVELPPFIVNLADADQARYLRMTVSLGVSEEEKGGEKPDSLFITRMRNAILAVVSEKKSDEILSVEGKSKLRKELLKAAQAASDAPEVVAIYITDFIVQL